jgi:hypothetical protein
MYMDSWTLFGTRFITGDAFQSPRRNNDNRRIKADWMTPAELLQWVRCTRVQMQRELAADFSLRHCPKHRATWESLHALERCALWHYYGVREA